MANKVLAVAGVAALAMALSGQVAALGDLVPDLGGAKVPDGARLSAGEVEKLANQAVSRVGGGVSTLMLRAMVEIESSRYPSAIRWESHIPDYSVGLMQTLVGTAQWLARDMGYRHFGVPSQNDLLRPEVSMYFGAAMVRWLSTWNAVVRSEMWIVQSYNGGPGNSNISTQNHWRKYITAKTALEGDWDLDPGFGA